MPGSVAIGASRLARLLSRGRSTRACAEEARAAGQWERAARLYADALIEEPGAAIPAAILWDRLGEMLERAEFPEGADLARQRAAELRRTAS